MKHAEDNHEIQVGDIINIDTGLGVPSNYEVHRVTKNYAFIKWSERTEGKFPRIYGFGFCIVPRPKFNTVRYKVYIKE
jgi:hypothetical protein